MYIPWGKPPNPVGEIGANHSNKSSCRSRQISGELFHTSGEEYILDKFCESPKGGGGGGGFVWQNVGGWVRFELTTSLVRFSRPDTTFSSGVMGAT